MRTQPVPSPETLAADILNTCGPRTVDGIGFATDAAAARARHTLIMTLVRAANRLRAVAASPDPSWRPVRPIEPSLPYIRCPWCTDFIERDVRAVRVGPFVLHAKPCAMEFAALHWVEARPAPLYPKPRGRPPATRLPSPAETPAAS